MVVVLAGRDVFFDGGAIVMDVFSYAVMDEACCATNVMFFFFFIFFFIECSNKLQHAC